MTETANQLSRRALVALGATGVLASLDLLRSPAAAAAASEAVWPMTLRVPDQALLDLKARLAATRWPEPETVRDSSQGVRLARMQVLVDYWLRRYDWRRCEARLNGFGQFKTGIDGVGVHFLHVRSRHAGALPLLLTHGWPGSIIEFHKTLAPLTDPTAHGGRAEDAFHVVVPSLPGFGFSDKPTGTGWGNDKIARAWAKLMTRLGYARYVAQGGDWGAGVTTAMAHQRAPGLAAIHLNMPLVVPHDLPKTMSPEEQRATTQLSAFVQEGFGYAKQQATRPQTIGYGLVDSPVAQAAYIYEKLTDWTDSGGNPESVLSRDEMLDNITLYWLTASGASAARIYWENSTSDFTARAPIELPVGCSIFPKEIYRAPRSWAQLAYKNLIHFHELPRGGHFAAFEQPELFVSELRSCFRTLHAV